MAYGNLIDDPAGSWQQFPTFWLYFRRYAPFDSFAGGNPLAPGQRSEGDHRTGASTSLQATSRTYGCIFFNAHDGPIYYFSGSSGTTTHTLVWGDIKGMADVSMTVFPIIRYLPGVFGFTARTAGGYPLAPQALTPEINSTVWTRIDFSSPGVMRISGEAFGDDFPNLEVFVVCARSGHSAILIDGRTTGGKDTGPDTRLWGSHSSQTLGTFSQNLGLNANGELAGNYTVGATTM
ncbi:MAG: hypothetical protein P4L55_10180 [Syntrophobacteraceae bacterium]|nr:hypothetical protein [Syntrophobacteraceae bacterium]